MNTTKVNLVSIILLFISSPAAGKDSFWDRLSWDQLSFSTAVSLNNKSLEFEVSDNLPVNPIFNTLDIALNSVVDKLYLSLSYGTSIDNASISSDQADLEFSRTDLNITAGYRFNESLSVFGGFLSGETQVEFIDVAEIPAVVFFNEELTESGPFIGINYDYPMRTGNISGSIAFARLEGEDKLTDDRGSNSDFGSTSGFSFGAKWSADFQKTLSYFVSVKRNQFRFGSDGSGFKLDENFTIFSIGVMKYF
jgi:hypothetical protein